MRQDARLENDGEVGRRHEVLCRLAGKDAKQVEKVEKEILVLARHVTYEPLVLSDLLIWRVVRHLNGAECVVGLERNDWLRHLR